MARTSSRMRIASGATVLVGAATALAAITAGPSAAAPAGQLATPIQHVVVVFQENVSFDPYFGAYPRAANTRRSKDCPAACSGARGSRKR